MSVLYLRLRYVLLAFVVCLANGPLFAATQVAGVEYARGAATAKSPGQDARIIGKGTRLYKGDELTTSSRSFAVILFRDGTRLTLRPKSTLILEEFNARRDRSANALLRLLRGGLRVVSGWVSKRNPNGFKLTTPVATIGIRGTAFDARLCDAKCKEEVSRYASRGSVSRSEVIARIAYARGRIAARQQNGNTRAITVGAPLYEGDTLETDRKSFAVLAFRDQSRVTVKPRTQFLIEKYRFRRNGSGNTSIMRLLRGGLRVLTGLIGKRTPKAYAMNTPVATIGIRGTGYDLQCQGDCVTETRSSSLHPAHHGLIERLTNFLIAPAYAALPSEAGLFAYVWSGTITLRNEVSRNVLEQNQTAFIANRFTKPVPIFETPEFFLDPEFRPDRLDIDFDYWFDSVEDEVPVEEDALIVSVKDGHVLLLIEDKEVLHLGRGETGQVETDGKVLRLDYVHPVHQYDPYPDPQEFDTRFMELLELFEEDFLDEREGELECRVN